MILVQRNEQEWKSSPLCVGKLVDAMMRHGNSREHSPRGCDVGDVAPLAKPFVQKDGVALEGELGWDEEDWLAFYDERAGIAEFDGGLPRKEAEAQALIACVMEWLSQHRMS